MANLIPAILTKDPDEYYEKLGLLEGIPKISEVHIDFEDGVFVPNKTFLPGALKIRNSRVKAEAHLMVANPEKYLEELAHFGISTIHFHYESFSNIHDLKTALQNAKRLDFRVGVVINPETEVSVFEGIIEHIDVAMLMSVYPGFQGAKFLPESLERMHALRKKFPDAELEIDGGVKLNNIEAVRAHGANRIVVGSGVWQNKDVRGTIYKLLEKLE